MDTEKKEVTRFFMDGGGVRIARKFVRFGLGVESSLFMHHRFPRVLDYLRPHKLRPEH